MATPSLRRRRDGYPEPKQLTSTSRHAPFHSGARKDIHRFFEQPLEDETSGPRSFPRPENAWSEIRTAAREAARALRETAGLDSGGFP